MTTSKIQRCKHCATVYTYHPSTYGWSPIYNDKDYCQECIKTIKEALKQIPVKFEKRFIDTTDYTREQIISAQEKRCNEISARRIKPGLFNLQDISNQQHIVCEQMLDPISKTMIYYSATWWSKTPDKVEIQKEVWCDVQKK